MEHQDITLMVLMDLSAAFDTVDHSVLLAELRFKFSVDNTVLDRFKIHLSPRDCKVTVGRCYAAPKPLHFSVPQGSLAGALLYYICASTLQYVIPDGIDIHGYADDHEIKKSFKARNIHREEKPHEDLSNCMSDVKALTESNN